MKNSKSIKAFSLIELSVVILIIGILIAGVTQASRMVAQMKLNTARTLTQSSPVASIRNLILWVESTSESSLITSEAEDGASLSTWYDISPTKISKTTFSQSTSDNKPIYTANAINGLPAIKFDGVSDYFEKSYDAELNPTSALTVFAVSKPDTSTGYTTVISCRTTPPSTGYMLYTYQTPRFTLWLGTGSAWVGDALSSTFSFNKTLEISATYDGTNIALYQNGTSAGTLAGSLSTNASGVCRIGAGKNEDSTPDYYFKGHIGEIIVFDRALKTEERKSVEKYLGQKWGIKIS